MNVHEYLQRARQALEQDEFDMAERYFNQVLSRMPGNAEATDGLRDLEVRKAQKHWSFLTWWVTYISALVPFYSGKPEKAYPALSLLHRYDPSNKLAAMAFARCAEKTDRLEEAREAYQCVLERDHTNIRALRDCAELLIRMDRLEEANQLYERLHKLKPRDERIAHRMRDISARAYTRVGIPEQLTARRAAMEKERMETRGGEEFQKKLKELQQRLEADPDNAGAAAALARHYRVHKMFEEANRVLGPVLDRDPGNEAARLEQARLWRAAGDLQLAVNLYGELHKADPESPLIKQEWLEARIALLEQTAKPGDPAATEEIVALRREKETARIQWLRSHMEQHPEDCRERAELGALLLKHGQLDESISTLQRLLQEPSWAGKGFFLLGQCFRERGNLELAAEQYEKSLDYFKNKGYSHVPTNELKAAYYHLGLTRESLGDKKAAREAYGQVYAADIHYKDVRERYEATFK